MNNIEIERKFLVLNEDYKQLSTDHYTIQQGYISKDPDRTVRIRIRTLADGSASAFLTIKSKPNEMGFSRFEWEKEVDLADAKQLLELCLPGVIEKTRWIIPATQPLNNATQPLNNSTQPLNNATQLTWEVDEFHGRLAGMTIAELELQSEQQTFTKPHFIGQEVTGNPRYYNANM